MLQKKLSRRQFIGTVAGATVVATLPIHVQGQDLPQLALDDPSAVALGYVHDTEKVDAAKYPKHSVDQKCSNCQLIQGADGEEWRPCPIFPGKGVAADGWCSAWVKRA